MLDTPQSRCAELRFIAPFGLGNKLLYIMSAALVAQDVRPDLCTIRLTAFRYGSQLVQDLGRHVNVSALASPCVLIGPEDAWRYNSSLKPHTLRGAMRDESSKISGGVERTMFTREYVASHCSADRPLQITFFCNFCGMAGWLKLAEHAEREWLNAQFARAQAAFAHPAGVARREHRRRHRELCIYYRGREREMGHVWHGGHATTRTSEIESIYGQLGVAAFGADNATATAAAAWRQQFDSLRIVSVFADAAAGSIVSNISGLPPLAPPGARPSSLCARPARDSGRNGSRGANYCLDEAIGDIVELTQCSAIMFDMAPAKISTFLLVATMAAGLTSCPAVGGLLMPREHCVGAAAGNRNRTVKDDWRLPFVCKQNSWSMRKYTQGDAGRQGGPTTSMGLIPVLSPAVPVVPVVLVVLVGQGVAFRRRLHARVDRHAGDRTS